jgi:hypothetical protein
LRGKNSTAGVCMTPPPFPSLPLLSPPPPLPHIPVLALSFAGFILGPPEQRSTLTALSGKKSTSGVCMTSPPISPLPHLSLPLPSPLTSLRLLCPSVALLQDDNRHCPLRRGRGERLRTSLEVSVIISFCLCSVTTPCISLELR